MKHSSLYEDDRRNPLSYWMWIAIPFVVVLAVGLIVLFSLSGKEKESFVEESSGETNVVTRLPQSVSRFHNVPTAFSTLKFPTTVDITAAPVEAFMPSNPSNSASAFFGSTRTGNDGRPRWHNGVDIAPVKKDRNGKALDVVDAMADGVVVYVNRAAGDSEYGNHVIVQHEDPIGLVYTLYAHLASIPGNIQRDVPVKAGAQIGVIGNTSSQKIHLSRSHLHIEFNLMLNRRFDAWYRARKFTPDRGRHHGWNLVGVDPVEIFVFMNSRANATFADFIQTIPAGFEILVANTSGRPMNYFDNYPALWKGAYPYSGATALRVAASGLILSGRAATDEETERLAQNRNAPVILTVDEKVLGRNGYRIIAKDAKGWVIAKNDTANRWFELLTY